MVPLLHATAPSCGLPFEPVTLTTRGGPFTAWEMLGGYRGSFRSSSKLAVVAHPITNAGVGGATEGPKARSRVGTLTLHRALADAGWSIIAFEPHGMGAAGDGADEAACECLVAAMSYVRAHRHFKYCGVALFCQGVGARAACAAVSRDRARFVSQSNLRVMSLFEPVGARSGGEGGIGPLAEQFAACRGSFPVAVSFKPSARPLVDKLLSCEPPPEPSVSTEVEAEVEEEEEEEEEEEDAGSLMEKLIEAVAPRLSRVIDTFREWDTDSSGLIDKKEFGKALETIGIGLDPKMVKKAAEELFKEFDVDDDGHIEYKELDAKLRKKVKAWKKKRRAERKAAEAADADAEQEAAKVTEQPADATEESNARHPPFLLLEMTNAWSGYGNVRP